MDEAVRRLEQAVSRLESAARAVDAQPAGPAAPGTSSGDVAARLDAVLHRLDRVLEG